MSVGLNRGSSSCNVMVKPDLTLRRFISTGIRMSGARYFVSSLSTRFQVKKPRARNKVFAPPSCNVVRALRYISTIRASSSSFVRSIKTSRRFRASRANCLLRLSLSRLSWMSWLRGSPLSIRSGRGKSFISLPSHIRSSRSPGSGASNLRAFLLVLKLRRLFRRDRSSSLRCHRASRSFGSKVASSASCKSSWGRSGASSNITLSSAAMALGAWGCKTSGLDRGLMR
ncbi:hypothetical protein D3C87_358030 [compost metagenome]